MTKLNFYPNPPPPHILSAQTILIIFVLSLRKERRVRVKFVVPPEEMSSSMLHQCMQLSTSCCYFIKQLGKGSWAFKPSPPYPGLRAP